MSNFLPLTYTEYMMGRIRIEDMEVEHTKNMVQLLSVVNGLLQDFGERRKITSGFRRPEDNAACRGSPKSKHMQGAAVDLEDVNGKLKAYMTEEMLDKYDLYMEHPSATPSWCHLSILPPKSGARIFKP